MRKIVLTYGLIAGAILSAAMLLTLPFIDRIGFDKGAVIGYTGMVAGFLMVYFGVRSYRDRVAGGRIGFGRALGVGLAISAIAIVCYVVTWQFVFHLAVPDFPEKFAAYEVGKLRQAGAPEAAIAAKQREMAEFAALYRQPLVNIGFTLLEPTPVALLFSLASAGLLSRRPRTAAAAHSPP